MRRAILASLAVVALLAAAGCGSSGDDQSQSAQQPPQQSAQRRPINADDLLGLLPTPETPEGANYNANDYSSTLTLGEYRKRATTAEDKKFANALSKAGLSRIYQRRFIGPINDADASIFLFRNAAGANAAFTLLQKSLAKPGAVNQTVSGVSADGLGSGSWAAHLTGAGSDAGIFLWRNGNVVVVSDMQCDDKCAFDVIQATQAYSVAIDDLVDQAAAS